jgi:hypothetical protein
VRIWEEILSRIRLDYGEIEKKVMWEKVNACGK